jgi:23S rRNA (adenine2030-N6)-methyltransferase
MLSYQHSYHIGNNADCHKHSLLAVLVDTLKKDPAAFLYVDTHAGRGLYDLRDKQTQKLQEHQTGIDLLWSSTDWPREAYPYRRVLDSLNKKGTKMTHYPGSPWIAEASRRSIDQILLYELHPQEYIALQTNMGRLKGVHIKRESGWKIVWQKRMTDFERGLILIDPSFEIKEDYVQLPKLIQTILYHCPNFIVALWYPILSTPRHEDMITNLEKMTVPYRKSEIIFSPQKQGMIGSGMFVFNPPPGFTGTEKSIVTWLQKVLTA